VHAFTSYCNIYQAKRFCSNLQCVFVDLVIKHVQAFVANRSFTLSTQRLTAASHNATQLQFHINLWIREEQVKWKRKEWNCLTFPAVYRQDRQYSFPGKTCSLLRRPQRLLTAILLISCSSHCSLLKGCECKWTNLRRKFKGYPPRSKQIKVSSLKVFSDHCQNSNCLLVLVECDEWKWKGYEWKVVEIEKFLLCGKNSSSW